MAILHDYHLHSSFSGDSTAPMEEMIKSALKKGLKGLCITEHYDADYPEYPGEVSPLFVPDFETYRAHYLELSAKYREHLDFSFGIELGLQPHLARTYYNCIEAYPFDFIIGSVHTCCGNDPYYSEEYFKDMEEEAGYRQYFKFILENLNVYDDFDSLGHLDYVVRYGPNKDKFYTYEKYQDLLDPILIKLVSMGKAIECNVGALERGLKTPNPGLAVLKKYRRLGGELVTICSDAHKPESIAANFDVARDLLLECGFTHYATYKNRVPILHRL